MDQGPTRINLNRVTDFDSIARHFTSEIDIIIFARSNYA